MKFWNREDYRVLKQTVLADKWKSHCPFCHIRENEDKLLIEWEWKYWFIAHAKYPYWWRNDHLLAIPNRCIEFTKDISTKEMSEFPEVERFMAHFYSNLDDYWSMIRQTSNLKSVNHLHYHYFPWFIHCSDVKNIFDTQKIRSNI